MMEQEIKPLDGEQPAATEQVRDAQDIAAAFLLREVKSFLSEGQPRHAIAHIIDSTGVSRDEASAFVAELQDQASK